VKEYLSFGAGVNSVALMLLLQDQGRKFESVFSDHRCEYPETYEYLDYLKDLGYEITRLDPKVSWKGKWNNLYDYFYFHKSIPLIQYRICTDKFKIQPFNKYIEKPAIVYIGYDGGEYKRIARQNNRKRKRKGIEYHYPLWEEGLTREGCKELIKEHGLKVPRKSGCWLCPFQSKYEWKRLMIEHPDLFKKAIELETNSNTKGLYLGKYCVSSIYQEEKLTDFPGFATPITDIMTNADRKGES